MHPEICRFGSVTIYSYGLMLVIGFLISSWLAGKEAQRKGISSDDVINCAFISFLAGIFGARILYVIQHFSVYRESLLEIFMLSHGGLSWFGGLISGTIAAAWFMRVRKLSVLKVLDILAPYVALAQAFGRIGCLLNGCCYGKPSVWGFYFPVHDAWLLPTQLFSSLGLILIFIIVRFYQNRTHVQGSVFFLYLALYSVKRFSIEFLRDDNPPIFGNLTLFHLMSIAVFMCAVCGFIIVHTQSKSVSKK